MFILFKEGWEHGGGEMKNHKGHTGSFTSFAVSPDSKSLAARLARSRAAAECVKPCGSHFAWICKLPAGCLPRIPGTTGPALCGAARATFVRVCRLCPHSWGLIVPPFQEHPPQHHTSYIHQGHCPKFVGG